MDVEQLKDDVRTGQIAPRDRRATIERIIEAGLSWFNLCEPVGPEHTPAELAEQIWIGVELPCRQHGAMQRFPVPGSPLYHHGQVSQARLGQVVAVVALATLASPETTSIAVNMSNPVGLFSGANAFFPDANGFRPIAIRSLKAGGDRTACLQPQLPPTSPWPPAARHMRRSALRCLRTTARPAARKR